MYLNDHHTHARTVAAEQIFKLSASGELENLSDLALKQAEGNAR